MTPGARVEAAIELLEEILAAPAAMDDVLLAYMRGRRYIGAHDRRAVIDLLYRVLRHPAQLDWWIERATGREATRTTSRDRVIAALVLLEGWTPDMLLAAFDGGTHRPVPLSQPEERLARALVGRSVEAPEQPACVRGNFPTWLEESLRRAFGAEMEAEVSALNAQAPLDVRVNTLACSRDEALATLAADGLVGQPTPLSPVGIRIPGNPRLRGTRAFQRGLVEVQDEGSQLVALLVGARSGERVVDFCAGGGGKTLALAAAMRNRGRVVACDVSAGRLARAVKRLRRAGVHLVETRTLETERDPWVKRHARSFDRVLVDAPCSGTGTWRRNPDSRLKLERADLPRLRDLQRRIVESAARLVRPGGRLVYATCSVLLEENDDQVAWLLETRPDLKLVPVSQAWSEALPGQCPCPDPFLRLTPLRHGVDGFFGAVLGRSEDGAGSPGGAASG